jgi:DNA-binding transcriptional LysR family regulator
MQILDWTDLQTFLAVVQTGQLTRAGSQLGVNGTTVTRRIRRLELRLGANLFEQTREGQILTEAGEKLLAKVEPMASAAAQVDFQSGGAKANLTGTLRISVSEGFGSWFLARHAPDFANLHPRLTLDIVANSGFLSLSKREADIAVMLSRPRAGPLMSRKLGDYTLQLFASGRYLETFGHPTSPAQLAAGHRFVGYIPDLIYAPELRYLDEIYGGLTPQYRSSSINAQHRLIAAGIGMGVLPSFMGHADSSLHVIMPDKRITRTFWLVTHKDTYKLSRVDAGRDWIMNTVQRYRAELMAET